MTSYKRPESVLVVVRTRAGKILLLKRADLSDFWQSVTGAMRWDETDPRRTALRELEEETGIRAAPAALRDLGMAHCFPIFAEFRGRYDPEVSHNVEHAFAVELNEEVTPILARAEHTEYGWFTAAQALSKATSWTDRDAIGEVERLSALDGGEAVVLVHGLWMQAWCLQGLAWRLRRAGFRVYCFSYRTVRANLRESAQRLQEYVQRLPHATIHLVGHSLGGIVIRALFRHYPQQRPGRIVTLATPHHGSCTAQRLAGNRFGCAILGKSMLEIVAGSPRAWPLPARAIGTISGSRSFGLGRWVATLPIPNDGAVSVEESSLDSAQDRLVLPVSHTGMILSGAVAAAVIRFLRHGRFAPN